MLCFSLCDIPCNIVEGAAKGFENEDADEFPLDTHHWCLVWVDGAWRFVDQCFGSEYMIRDMTEWDNEQKVQKGKMYYVGEEHFLTDPELFIYKHFPVETENQLLARPVTHEEFNKMAIVSKSYFDFYFEELSEPKSKFDSKNGQVTLWFKPGQDVTMAFALFRHFYGKVEDKAEKGLNENVRLQNKEDGRKELWLTFKEIGLYKLQVLVRQKTSTPFRELVKYVIFCGVPDFKQIENPLLSHGLQEIGPGMAWKKLKIKVMSPCKDGIFNAVDGIAKLELKCKESVVFSFHLKKQDADEPIEKCTLIETNHDITTLYLKMPSQGTFLLKVFTGKKGEETLQHTCNFLVESDMRCIATPFPNVFKAVGSVNDCDIIKPLKGGAYMKLTGKLDDYVIEANIMKEANFLIKLALWDGKEETDLSQFACFEINSNVLRILCRFKHAGDYLLRIFTQTDLAAKSFTLSWKYLLEVENPTYEYQPYPEKLKDYHPGVKLIKPNVLNLGQSTDYQFEVECPGMYMYRFVKSLIVMILHI